MAIYRLEAKIIGRTAGRSSTASAAYRAADAVTDERSGIAFDYTRRHGVLHTEILAPADAPEWMRDRAQLWNAVERIEKRKDAQLSREVLLSLPYELTHAQRVDLVREFVRSEFVAHGMIADVAFHAPHRKGDDRNYHAHVLLTMRELAGAGFGKKVREWNATEQLEAWREHWAASANRHLERYGHDVRIDHRSLAEQGIDREPEPKQGPVATEMEREGRASHAGDDRRAAQQRNAERETLAEEVGAVTAEIIDLETERTKLEQQAMDARRYETLKQEQARREEDSRQVELRRSIEAVARENADRQVRLAETMREQHARLGAFAADVQRRAEEAQREHNRKREAEARGKAAEGEITDARSRYAQALGDEYDIRDPYGSLARAAMAEYKAFLQSREKLTEQIAKERAPEARKTLELRKEIEGADYMAITSERIAGQSVVITGRNDSEEAVRQRARAAEFSARATELRAEFRDHETARAEAQQRTAEPVRPEERRAEEQRAQRQAVLRQPASQAPEATKNPPDPSKDDAKRRAERHAWLLSAPTHSLSPAEQREQRQAMLRDERQGGVRERTSQAPEATKSSPDRSQDDAKRRAEERHAWLLSAPSHSLSPGERQEQRQAVLREQREAGGRVTRDMRQQTGARQRTRDDGNER